MAQHHPNDKGHQVIAMVRVCQRTKNVLKNEKDDTDISIQGKKKQKR